MHPFCSKAPIVSLAILIAITTAASPEEKSGSQWTGIGALKAEVGENDFQISQMNPAGDTSHIGTHPDVAFNATDNEYLVVWAGSDESNLGGPEIFAQRIDAATGALVGETGFRISLVDDAMEPPNFSARFPAVAWNSLDNEYLVVWEAIAEIDQNGFVFWEVFGQRLDNQGNEIGADDFAITNLGERDAGDILQPDVVFNPTSEEYLVVLTGRKEVIFLPSTKGIIVPTVTEREVWGQRLDRDGNEVGANDFRISSTGPQGDSSFFAQHVAAAWNSVDNEYLVVWSGNDDTPPYNQSEREIYAQRLDADGAQIGANDFRISNMGNALSIYFAFQPAVVHNPEQNEFLVAWEGNHEFGDPPMDNREVFGQRLAADGTEVGDDDFPLSDLGDGLALDVAAAFDPLANAYIVTWYGLEDDLLSSTPRTAFVQRLDGVTGAEQGDNDILIGDLELVLNESFVGIALTYSSVEDEFLAVWTERFMVDNLGADIEILGQRFTRPNVPPTAMDDAPEVDEDSQENLLDVLSNDSDVDPDVLQIELVGSPNQNGAAFISAGQDAIVYTPAPDFFGVETFTYQITDGVTKATSSATVTVTVNNVNDPPTANDDEATVDQDSAMNSIDVLANDSFAPDEGETLFVTNVGAPDMGGAANPANDGLSIVYTPAPAFAGTETFTYTIGDGNGGTDTAMVTVTVAGMGEGQGEGAGEGSGEGQGEGMGEGVGEGAGEGSGEGAGEGQGEGVGEGAGEGMGEGSGEGQGEGTGEGQGEGSGEGQGEGAGEGSGEGAGEGAGEFDVCAVLMSAASALDAFYSDFAIFNDGMVDLAGTGLPDRYTLALTEQGACVLGSDSLMSATATAFDLNTDMLTALPAVKQLEGNEAIIAALALTSDAMASTLVQLLADEGFNTSGLEFAVVECDETGCLPQPTGKAGEYMVFSDGAKQAVVQPYAAEGDFDGDGATNKTEFDNVQAVGGGIVEFITAATDPNADGMEMPDPMGCSSSTGDGTELPASVLLATTAL